MSETNLLHYIQSGDFVDQLIESQTFDTIYADVGHLFPNCIPLSDFQTSGQSVLIIISRLTVSQLFEYYDIADLSHVVIINLRVGVAGIGHKFAPEFDDIALMTGYGWRVYEPLSLSDLDSLVVDTDQPTYVRITHRYLPSQIDMKSRGGMWYFGELSSSITLFPASTLEAVGVLDPESQKSQYVMVSDWSQWYVSEEFSELASTGGASIILMEQSPQTVSDYIDTIQTLYPKHRIVGISIGADIRDGDIIVDEHRDEWYGCDSLSLSKKL